MEQMQRKIYCVFVAGGSGSRMGGDTPKQFLPIKGKPVLQMTLERFLEAFPDANILTVLPKQHFETWKTLCAENHFICPQILVEGGLTRFHSVRNALERVPDGALVMIHDGVRPFPSVELLKRMLEKMESCKALIPVVPVVDTLRSTVEGQSDPDRSSLVAVQTPQLFLSEEIKHAYDIAYSTSFTDDASVARAAGIPVECIQGERFNIKLTTPDDMLLAEALCLLG